MQKPGMMKLMSRHGLLVRGESVVASTGLALAALLLAAMASAAWWTLRVQRASMQQARALEVQAAGSTLASAIEVMLANGELSSARRIVAEAGQAYQLSTCRVVLPDGGVLADAKPSGITLQEMPENWRGAPELSINSDQAHPHSTAAGIELRVPVEVAGRGSATLEIVAPAAALRWAYWEAQAGLGAIGAVALVGLLVSYRRMRARLRPIGAIRESLLAMEQGETSFEALRVSPESSPEARCWNALLADREALRTQMLAERARESCGDNGDRRRANSDLEGVCDAMWQGLLLIDEKLCVKYANGAAAILLGSDQQEMVGREIAAIAGDDRVVESVKNVVSGALRRRVTIEVKRESEQGGGVLRFGVRPVRRGDAAAAMVLIEDITQQRLAEEARNTFVAQATHELRMPLTNIRMYAENALDAGSDDPATKDQCLNVITQESRRLERIVGDMLSVAEIEAGRLKLRRGDVRLDALFAELAADYEVQAKERRIALTFSLPPKLPVIKGDRDKIALALHNLIGNALKYTPPDGSVNVQVEVIDGRLVVEVTDTGIGVSEEESELIFEKFYRSKDQRVAGVPGSGLGLALAREVIRLHGGDVSVRSQVNQGSTFTLMIPTYAEAA